MRSMRPRSTKRKLAILMLESYKSQYWLVGIKCRTTGRFVVYPVLWRNRETLMKIILKHVVLGSTIYSDCWSVYYKNRTKESHLVELGYIHHVVNHSFQFVSNISNSIHTNTIERLWGTTKSYIRMLRSRAYIDGYIAKFYLNQVYSREERASKVFDILSEVKQLIYTD